MDGEIRTWHHGLIARWWAEFNHGGSDIEFFQNTIRRYGQPALDAGCGTGRLLLPFLHSGLDVDGSDVSPDMIAWCNKQAEAEGLAVNLYTQAMHELDLPRRYRTIVLCGVFGLGGNRSTDLEGLRRIHSHLRPNGRLVMDHHLENDEQNFISTNIKNSELPAPWPESGDRRATSAGDELELRTRLLEVDADERKVVRQISVRRFDNGLQTASDTHSIVICVYSIEEVEAMLMQAGFCQVKVNRTLEVQDSTLDIERVVLEASA